jgi:hypothetical protein
MEKLIGTLHGQAIFADMDGNKIKRLSSYYVEHADNTYDGNTYLSDSSFGGEWTLNNVTFKSGMELAEDFEPIFDDESIKDILVNEDYYHANGSHCDECGTFHDTEQYYDISYIIGDGYLLCKTCANAEDLLVEVDSPRDIFRSKDITGMDFASDEFEVVETLFCDSSGFGSPHEPALTEAEAVAKMEELIEEHGQLFSGLTGIGQFQVYVTLYKKKTKKKRKTA